MTFRESTRRWGWALLIAMPGAGLFILASRSSGWWSTLSWILMFTYLALLIVAGILDEVRGGAELEDELDGRGQEARDAEDR